jgi:hypothetical protein
MKEEALSDALLRQFLLGRVTDEERQRIESLFLTDAEAKERTIAAEQELIDDYLEDGLTTEDRKQFHLHYGQTPEQQRKLKIARSIKEWAETATTEPVPVTRSSWGVVGQRLRSKGALVTSIALAAMILIVAAIWLRGIMEQRNRRLAIEQELAQLNSPSELREPLSQTPSLDLSPVIVRGAEQQPEIKLRPGIRIVELRLPWIQKERYPIYQAEVRPVGTDESFTIRNLQVENDREYAIRMRLPTNILKRGQYQIRLTGIAGDGASGITEEYPFVVSD